MNIIEALSREITRNINLMSYYEEAHPAIADRIYADIKAARRVIGSGDTEVMKKALETLRGHS